MGQTGHGECWKRGDDVVRLKKSTEYTCCMYHAVRVHENALKILPVLLYACSNAYMTCTYMF